MTESPGLKDATAQAFLSALPAGKEICLIHANCLGAPLARLLGASPLFASRYAIFVATNFRRDPIGDELMERCGLFLYQRLGENWGELASERLVQRLPHGTRSLRLPIPVFQGYWPLWTNASPMNFADRLLERLVAEAKELGAEAIQLLYFRRRALDGFDLEAPARESLERTRKAESEGALPTADFIEENWRKRPVFDSVNHPSPCLLQHIADQTLKALEMPPLDEAARRMPVSCDEGGVMRFEQPIDPRVAEHHGLAFAGPDRRYHVYDLRLNFAGYTACYIDCRLLGRSDFLVYLNELGGQADETPGAS